MPLFLALILLFPMLAWGDVACDGTDDDLSTGTLLSNFLTAATGSVVAVFYPTGTPQSAGTGCWQGEGIMVDAASGADVALFRNGNLAGQDRLCASNYDGAFQEIAVAYTVGNRAHLAWVHSAGTLSFYKDGALVASVASGNTADITRTFRVCGGTAATSQGSMAGQGRIVEAKVYNVALTAAQIAAEGTSAVHNVIPVAATARWNFDDCTIGATGNGVIFADRSGNGRPITGNWGPNTTGLVCQGSTIPYPWGVW
jgi:Concanavalin A-like lectin/glucanases superfamily